MHDCGKTIGMYYGCKKCDDYCKKCSKSYEEKKDEDNK